MHDQGKVGKDYRSLKGNDDVYTITLERALELLAEPKTGRGRGKSSATPLRELGPHSENGEPINIYDGPYGPYIKHGKINASLPEGETVEAISLDTALKALAEKAKTKKSSRTSKAASKTDKGETDEVANSNGKTAKTSKTAAKKTTSSNSKSAKSTTESSKTSSSAKSSNKSKSTKTP
jgi:DNA topoisomerase-1